MIYNTYIHKYFIHCTLWRGGTSLRRWMYHSQAAHYQTTWREVDVHLVQWWVTQFNTISGNETGLLWEGALVLLETLVVTRPASLLASTPADCSEIGWRLSGPAKSHSIQHNLWEWTLRRGSGPTRDTGCHMSSLLTNFHTSRLLWGRLTSSWSSKKSLNSTQFVGMKLVYFEKGLWSYSRHWLSHVQPPH